MSEFRQRSVLWRAFVGWLDAILLMFAVVLALVFFGPSEISAHAWKPAAGASRSGAYVPNNGLSQGHLLPTRWVEQGEVAIAIKDGQSDRQMGKGFCQGLTKLAQGFFGL